MTRGLISINQLINIQNISRITLTVNGSVVFDGTILNNPLILKANDVINVRVYKGFYNDGIFTLMGNTI